MASPTLTDLAYTKNYADLEVWTEAEADIVFASFQTYINDTVKDNLQQLARDAFGVTDYTFDSDGAAQYTNNLFDKQQATDTYNGGDITIGTTADAAYASVDAVNAAIAFTPEKAGRYMAVFTFVHRAVTTATTEGTIETSFRITDGTDASMAVRSGGYLPATAANSGILCVPVTIFNLFNWTTTVARTVTLQKFNRTGTNISTNVVSATAASGEINMTIWKI